MIEETKDQIIELIGGKREDIVCISAKVGTGTEEVLEKIIEKIPPPATRPNGSVIRLL